MKKIVLMLLSLLAVSMFLIGCTTGEALFSRKPTKLESVVGAAFGGCPAGSTASVCINSQKAYCTGSLEHGAQLIDCGMTRCSGRFPSGGCWGGDTQGYGEFQKEKPASVSFGGCPAGSTSSVCVDNTQMLCIGSEPYGEQIISCAGGCSGEFPQASCS